MSEGSGISAEELLGSSECPRSVFVSAGVDGPVVRLAAPGSYPRKPVVAVVGFVFLVSLISALTQLPRYGDAALWAPFWVGLFLGLPWLAVEVLQSVRNGNTVRWLTLRRHEIELTCHHGGVAAVNLHGLTGLEIGSTTFGCTLDLQDRSGVITRYRLADHEQARWVYRVIRAWAVARATEPDPEQLARLARLASPSRASEAGSG